MTLSKQCPLKTRSIGLRCIIAIWWFTDKNCTCNSHFEPLDGGIGAHPYGAVETVPLQFIHLFPQQPMGAELLPLSGIVFPVQRLTLLAYRDIERIH